AETGADVRHELPARQEIIIQVRHDRDLIDRGAQRADRAGSGQSSRVSDEARLEFDSGTDEIVTNHAANRPTQVVVEVGGAAEGAAARAGSKDVRRAGRIQQPVDAAFGADIEPG